MLLHKNTSNVKKSHLIIMELIFILTVSFCILLYSIQCNKPEKVIIFDFDETLGSFSEMNLIVHILYSLRTKPDITFTEITFHVCSLFPEYFRKDIFSALEFIKQSKENKDIHKVVMYTNNNGGKYWVSSVLEYIHHVLGCDLFDEVITSYHCLHEEQNDMRRISEEKQIADIKKIINLHPHSEFVFFDDRYHEKMDSEFVYYIKINPYIYSYDIEDIIKRLQLYYFDKTCVEFVQKRLREKYNNYKQHFNAKCSSQYNNTLDMERIILNIDLICSSFILL